LGKEICRQLNEAGCEVILTARNEEVGQRSADELGVRFRRLDVLNEQEIVEFRQWLEKTYGRLDVLVNNAALLLDQKKKLTTSSPEILQRTLETNALAPIHLICNLLPLLLKSKQPRVVNVTSRLAQSKAWGLGAPSYRIAKLALNAATSILAMELEDTPVKINAASPGWVKTHMGGDDAPEGVEQGAKVVIELALLPNDGPSGGFFEGTERLEW